MIKFRTKIIDIIEEAKGTRTYLLERPKDFTWREGAHTHVGLIGFDEGEKPNKSLVRHMSIMTLASEDSIGFTTRITSELSEFKRRLIELNIGDEVILFKIGSKMYLRRMSKPLVFLSMGVGIATMRPLIKEFVNDNEGIPSITNINVDSTGEFIYKKELDELSSSNSNYKNYWLNSRISFYEALNQLPNPKDSIYYVVGSDLFVLNVVYNLRDKGVSSNNILIDKKDEIVQKYFEHYEKNKKNN